MIMINHRHMHFHHHVKLILIVISYIGLCLVLSQPQSDQTGVNLDVREDEEEEALVINVKNGGGEVYRETIVANTSSDVITVRFRYTDGSIYTQFIDFKSVIELLHFN